MKENEFSKITELLPAGWEEAPKETSAFTRSRKIKNPANWQKCKGFDYVDLDGESVLVKLHWY